MNWDVVEVKPERDWTILVRFADGLSGHVRFKQQQLRGVFEPLRDPLVFEQVYLDHGAVAWPGGIDLAPDAMYREIRERGECLVGESIHDHVA